MKSLGIFDTKNRLSELCEEVARGEGPLVVTRHGKPLVRIVPYQSGDSRESVWDTVEECRGRYGPIEDELELPDRDPARNRPDPLA